ncbi:FAD-binding and (Fe-S)-binding domain-containing protein [Thermobifida fusca]|mgnify:CR=1 FL=1|uniref:Oxidoreductase n=1 Tax=Thermobifida fusca TM51 TaxID=1169414 RepID=A0A9P2T8M1_THEFU|nr:MULTISPECIES: FAD-binding and (Fe-S)-binding domain-containing protein [Thermobifida]EOR69989.1 oxidoreductase [Thermobifida fusca TM51]MBO2529935.1 FAD-binding oxidoreductase [Thermobifida sp.]PPS94551.1 dimethylmenaquinone methyltransferase [Thermobifida fusca]PZN66381.1 MAG: FAD-binding oxidoreductase [Thermobifida fusca]QOS59330.1 FAD-binding oxidoreductase [Thermobifida fusca]
MTTVASHEHTPLARTLAVAIRGDVDFSPLARALYSADASIYRRIPLGVVYPRHTDDIAATVEICREAGVGITMRGGGTSCGGQALGTGVVVDTSRYFNRILSVDPEARRAVVEPGVVLDTLRTAVAQHGLTFGPDPSTHNRCTLGGMIGNNACGSHSVAWGTTADNITALHVVTADGRHRTVTATQITTPDGLPDHALMDGLDAVAAHALAPIRTELGRYRRQVSGYPLQHLLPERRDYAKSLVGTEGGCAITTSATLTLVPAPKARVLLLVGCADRYAAAEIAHEFLAYRPLTVEGMDTELLGPRVADLPEGGAWLYVEFGGDTPAEAEAAARRAERAFAAHVRSTLVVTDPADRVRLWRIREDAAGLATRPPSGDEAWPGWEDASVPAENLAAYLRDFDALCRDEGLSGPVYGHFGEGCLHVRLNADLTSPEGVARYRRFVEAACDIVVRHGGVPSGEHGDGQARSELLSRVYSPALLNAFADTKHVWDPHNLLNPGAVVRPRPLDADVRPLAMAAPVRPVLRLAEDRDDFARAVRRCVGVGKCRAHAGAMCPSYQVTREEKDSTRGRARVLGEMLAGEVVTAGWRSPEVREALELCLSCKACARECPVGVDVAAYKSEFLYHHYRHRIRPRAHYTLGWLPVWLKPAGVMPGLVNTVARSPLAGLLKRVAGIDRRRDLPVFATRRQRRASAADRTPLRRGFTTDQPRAVLWTDSFTLAFFPQVLADGRAVLRDAGWEVVDSPARLCCGLTWTSTGQLGVARRVAERTVRALLPAVRAGAVIVGLEPSCTEQLRRELPRLLGTDEAAEVAGAVRTLAQALTEFTPDWEPPRITSRVIAQVHCHQHAGSGWHAERALLERAGATVEVPQNSCCGLAGDFGFVDGHYEVSLACAEQGLLPAVRAAGAGDTVLTEGFSCRLQVTQAHPEARPVHLATLLRNGRGSQATAGQ